MPVDPIRIDGLRQLQAALKAADGESQKQLRVALNQAAELVVAEVRTLVPVKTGKARASYRAQSGQREAKVVGGSRAAPHVGWLEWGGRVGRGKKVVRPRVRESRYVWPAYRRKQAAIAAKLEEAIVGVARGAGFDVKGD